MPVHVPECCAAHFIACNTALQCPACRDRAGLNIQSMCGTLKFNCRKEEDNKEHKDAAASQPKQLTEMPGSYPQFGIAILLLYGLNQGLSKLTASLGIQFPSALIGNAIHDMQQTLHASCLRDA